MGKGNLVNQKPCPSCGANKKYKKCCMNKDKARQRELLIVKPAIYDKKGVAHQIDEEIGRLLIQKADGGVTEQDVMAVLRKYNLKETLMLIGNFSRYVFHGNKDHFGQAGHLEESTDIIITQFALGYIANMLILSGADNNSSKNLKDDPYSFLTLCNIYSNKLVHADTLKIKNNEKFTHDHLISFMVRMWYEQISSVQFSTLYLMTRNIVFFDHLAKEIEPKKFDKLSDIFFQENGITIDEYMKIGFGFFAGTQNFTAFRPSYLSAASVKAFETIYTEEKINKFLDILAIDYDQFRELDAEMNKELDPIFTKNRFNPLFAHPFIKEQLDGEAVYIIPNMTAFVYKTFGGIFWWFNNYFERVGGDKKLHLSFRDFFGNSIFEQYVGLILKEIYGGQNVHPEITYSGKSNKFSDWHIVIEDKCYLFEVKANQFALLSRQTGNLDVIINKELKKVVEAIVETFKNVRDINNFDELVEFRGKEIIPIIVFLEIPLISSDIYKEKILALLSEIETKENLEGLKDFKYYLLNIDELELYSDVKDKIDIESVFEAIKDDNGQGFVSYITKVNDGKKLFNAYLDQVYEDFWEGYSEQAK